MIMEHWWYDVDRENRNSLRKACCSDTSSSTNPIRLATYTRLSGEKSTTNCLSHAKAMTTVARRIHGTSLVTVLYVINRLSHVTDLAGVILLPPDHGKSLAIVWYANRQNYCTTLATVIYTKRLSHGTHLAAEF